MGKFDGILLCTDLDDTLLTSEKNVSEENKKAIEYFKSEGGLFTFATGRVPKGADVILNMVTPNAPLVCYNGAGIYDSSHSKLMWSLYLDKNAKDVIEFIDKNCPYAGIVVCTDDEVFFCKRNRFVDEHQKMERFPDNDIDYHDVASPMKKVIFMMQEEQISQIKQALAVSGFADNYTFVQSSPNYYELLPKNADKGIGLEKLADLLRIDREKTIAIGDNENDLSLIQKAGVGVAVANASDRVKNAADYITVDNNSHAVSAVIYSLNNGNIAI